MASFAGIDLTQPTPELAALIERYISVRDVVDFTVPYLPVLRPYLPYPDQSLMPVRLGRLWWPQGATRWSVGHFLATEKSLAQIRAVLAYNVAGFLLGSGSLVLADDTTTLTTPMWLLPPRPLFQPPVDASQSADNSTLPISSWLLPIHYNTFVQDALGNSTEPPWEQLYLVTLVDERYFWWQRASSVTLTVGTTTWAGLISNIASDLGVSISHDTILPAYLKPAAAFTAYLNYLPFLLDQAAFAVGQRLVRSLTGAVSLQNATTALTSINSQLGASLAPVMGGGVFAFNL